MSDEKPITKREAIEQIAAQLENPISIDDFAARVLTLWPSQAKDPARSVRDAVRGYDVMEHVLLLDKKTVIPTRVALRGVRFRVTLSPVELERGMLLIEPNFTGFVPRRTEAETIKFIDVNGQVIPTSVVTLEQEIQSPLFGSQISKQPAFDLRAWYEQNQIAADDNLLVTIVDWHAARFQLERETADERARHRAEIEQRNRELADALFDMLEKASYERLWPHKTIPTLYARLPDHKIYPGDHWAQVVKQDERMYGSSFEIGYADDNPFSFFADLYPEDNAENFKIAEAALSPKQARQVYRFKAWLKHRKGLWRRIEIQGEQTLADFDRALRAAFSHDSYDHLSGFWKRIRRGNSKRFREVDLGSINPFGEGEAADVQIAELKLSLGDQLKYVYDFGDWIEHRVELEAIEEPQEGAEYPRTIEQNKPRHRYCIHCKEEGRKTVATWICIECSDREQAQIFVCEDCLDKHHEDHYVDELVY